jgi:acylphosphatase
MRRLYARVEGRVQGVSFRDYVRQHAKRLGLHGWVRNLADGSVEVVAEGEDQTLAQLVLVLEKGPSLSRVDSVETKESAPTGEFSDFRIRW